MKRLFFCGLLLATTACAADTQRSSPGTPQKTTVTVAAAASLTDAMQDIETAFEQDYPEINVNLNVAASGVLKRQIEQNAPIDVFASAAELPMDELQQQGLIREDSRTVFARNQIVVVVPESSSLEIDELGDLQDTAIARLAIGNPETVPAGSYAKQALETAKLYEDFTNQQKFVFGENVRNVLSYVESSSVEAAIVYQTDAAASDRVRVAFPIPAEYSQPIRYPIAVVGASDNSEAALQFVEFISGEESQAILQKYGFLPGEE